MHSTTSANNSANNSVRMKRICIVIPLAYHPSFARYCSTAAGCVDREARFRINHFEIKQRVQHLKALFLETNRSVLLAFHVDLVEYLLHIGHARCGALCSLPLCDSFYTTLQGEHAVLGLKIDMLFFQPIGNQGCLVVFFNGLINVGGDTLRVRFSANRLNAYLIDHSSVTRSSLGDVG